MSRWLILLTAAVCLTGCINRGQRRLGSIVSQHDAAPQSAEPAHPVLPERHAPPA